MVQGLGKGYEFFEHTADVGIRAIGATQAELFVHMAQGLKELIAEDSALQPLLTKPIELAAENVESLLLVWLQELLFLFSTERFLAVEYALDEVTPASLRGRLRGETFDPARHTQGLEVKAVTRHQFRVERRDDMWTAQMIVDI